MGKSIRKITDENRTFYMDTYASKITRRNLVGMILFLIFWSIELFIMKLSFDRVYYFKLARSENLVNQEVKEWITEKIWQNIFSSENFIIVIVIIAMVILFFCFWKMKSYELHKYWKMMFYLPLFIVITGNIFVFLLLLRRGKQYIGSEFAAILFNIISYFLWNKILFPLEIKRNENRDWKVFEWIGRMLDCLESKCDIAEKFIKKKL